MNAWSQAGTLGGVRAGAGERSGTSSVSILAVVSMAFLLFLGVGLFHVWSRIAVIEEGYRISQAQAAKSELEEQHRVLTLQLRRLNDPARLDQLASNAGMAVPRPGQVVFLEE